MAHEHLIKWGKDAFEKELSLEHIENYLLKRGLKRHEALNALHEITSFERKIQEAANVRKELLSIPVLLLLILSGVMVLYLFGVIKWK